MKEAVPSLVMKIYPCRRLLLPITSMNMPESCPHHGFVHLVLHNCTYLHTIILLTDTVKSFSHCWSNKFCHSLNESFSVPISRSWLKISVKSGGGGQEKCISFPVHGCVNPRANAWRQGLSSPESDKESWR